MITNAEQKKEEENGEKAKDEETDDKKKKDEEDEDMTKMDEEVCMPICPRLPYSPRKEERRNHCLTHWPSRSWCAECVMGKSRESPHKFLKKK